MSLLNSNFIVQPCRKNPLLIGFRQTPDLLPKTSHLTKYALNPII
jgi:hypothetical protein